MSAAPPGRRRIPYIRRCEVRENGAEPMSGLICNLSSLGAYVALEEIPPTGVLVDISFRLPHNERPIQVQAQVTWENPFQDNPIHGLPPGCGMRFLALSEDDERRIGELIRSYRPPVR